MGNAIARRSTNGISAPRLLAAIQDPRVHGLLCAVSKCAAAGNRRENLMAGRYAWQRHLVALLDELVLYQCPPDQILTIETAVRDAIRLTLYAGNAAPRESLGVALSRESLAESSANSLSNLLIDDPQSPVLKRQLLAALAVHEAEIVRARMVLLRDIEGVPLLAAGTL